MACPSQSPTAQAFGLLLDSPGLNMGRRVRVPINGGSNNSWSLWDPQGRAGNTNSPEHPEKRPTEPPAPMRAGRDSTDPLNPTLR